MLAAVRVATWCAPLTAMSATSVVYAWAIIQPAAVTIRVHLAPAARQLTNNHHTNAEAVARDVVRDAVRAAAVEAVAVALLGEGSDLQRKLDRLAKRLPRDSREL